ncbi:MAG: putative DNA binding domain-containing protein [Deltaproteobacteria bacterium]|nr:putative DNA binding domain-containing protein [Deltaproteobacteria bacterium]
MTIDDLQLHIADGENDTTEFKRGVDLRQIGPALAAFANTQGGLLLLGVDDHSRAIVGVSEDPESVAERLTGFLQSGLSFPCSARLGRVQTPQGWLHWVEVARQRGFEPLKYGGRVYVRRGRASVEPSPPELQELLNTFGYVVTEEQAVSSAGPADIDPAAFARYVATLGIDVGDEPALPLETDLRIRGAVVERAGQLCATLYGLLAFGKNPQGHAQTGSFWVECVAYDGTDRADPVLHVAEARGRLDEQVDRALGWFRASGRSETHAGATRTDRSAVPLGALREALVNAVCHRDYAITGSRILLEVFADRVVVTNPGTLPNHMSRESVMAGGHPRSRNELLATVMQALRYMEGRGRGWPRMRRDMRQHNGSEPALHEDRDSRWVRVTLLR